MFAQRYADLMKKYLELKEQMASCAITGYDPALLDEFEEAYNELFKLKEEILKSPHYVVPDKEFTKH